MADRLIVALVLTAITVFAYAGAWILRWAYDWAEACWHTIREHTINSVERSSR
jgi:hypothetical protein